MINGPGPSNPLQMPMPIAPGPQGVTGEGIESGEIGPQPLRCEVAGHHHIPGQVGRGSGITHIVRVHRSMPYYLILVRYSIHRYAVTGRIRAGRGRGQIVLAAGGGEYKEDKQHQHISDSVHNLHI